MGSPATATAASLQLTAQTTNLLNRAPIRYLTNSQASIHTQKPPQKTGNISQRTGQKYGWVNSAVAAPSSVLGHPYLSPSDNQGQSCRLVPHNCLSGRGRRSNAIGLIHICPPRCVFSSLLRAFHGQGMTKTLGCSEIQRTPTIVNTVMHGGADTWVHNPPREAPGKEDSAPHLCWQLNELRQCRPRRYCWRRDGGFQTGCRPHSVQGAALGQEPSTAFW